MPSEELLERCAAAFGFSEQLVEVGLSGGAVVLAVAVDEGEHERRAAAGLGAVVVWESLTALWEIPHSCSIQIPGGEVGRWILDAVESVPDAFARHEGWGVLRLARPPVRFGGALSIGRTAERPLRKVTQVSALTEMGIAVLGGAAEDDPAVLDARLFGVGVAHVRSGEVEVESAPAAVPPTPGPFMWWVAEKAYEQLLAA